MSTPPASSPVRRPLPLTAVTGWQTIPSWLGSMILHGLLVLSLLTFFQTPPPRGDFPGDGGDSFRPVGIRVGSENAGTGNPATPAASTSAEIAPPQSANNFSAATMQSLPVPSSISLPAPALPGASAIIGAGPVKGMSSLPADQFIKAAPSTALSAGAAGSGSAQPGAFGGPPGGGGKGTSLFGIGDVGQRFIYVIDRSSSMGTDNALQAAKLELLASLQQLDESQKFQILFYSNRDVHVLDTREGKYELFRGTDSQRLRVTEQIRDIIPTGGTSHLPAILEGLKFKPDVLFLLTDGAADTALGQGELQEIKRFNRGGAHIHCIEFGRGAKSPLTDSANFLIELARENSGRYIYRDVRQILRSRENS